MSIATETQRLIQAKADLKTSIEKRGANIPTESRIDTFADILDACPFAVSGTFVPEEDTKTFSLTGLPFTPTSLMILCPDEVGSSDRSPENVVCASMPKGLYSSFLYTDSSGANRLSNIKPTSTSIVQWSNDGVTMNTPDSITLYFKEGFTYNYYITGGVE